MIEPSGSSVLSSVVAMVWLTLPLVRIVIVLVPLAAPKSPLCITVTLTASGAVGAGSAVTVNIAVPPSVIPEPAVTLIVGSAGASSSVTGPSSSCTATLAERWVEETV